MHDQNDQLIDPALDFFSFKKNFRSRVIHETFKAISPDTQD